MSITLDTPSRPNKFFLGIFGMALIVFTAAADYFFAGRIASIAFLYLVPIVLCAWVGGLVFGEIFSVVSFLSWTMIRLLWNHGHSPGAVFYADNFFQSISFGIAAFVVSLIKNEMDRWKMMAVVDPLTNICNLRFFYDVAEREISRAKRYKRPFTFVFIDVDDFGMLNSRMGRKAGDDILRTIAKSIIKKVRCTDVVARLGVDEFGILMPETSSENGSLAIRRIKSDITDNFQKHHWAMTITIGSITFINPPQNAGDMMKKIQLIMVQAKQKGKNNTVESVN